MTAVPDRGRPSAQLCSAVQRPSTAVLNDRNASSNSSSVIGDDEGAVTEGVGDAPVAVTADDVRAVRTFAPIGDPSPVVGSHPGAAANAPLFPTVTSEKLPASA